MAGSSDSRVQEVRQPPTYPKHNVHSVCQHPPATIKPTETYLIVKESLTTGNIQLLG